MSKMKEAPLQHPELGFFKGRGKTQKEANNDCLVKIARALERSTIREKTQILYYIQAEKALEKHTGVK